MQTINSVRGGKFTILVLAATLAAFAQSNASIHGTVTDPSDAAIPGASVTASSADGTVKTISTDALGRYVLNGLPPGSYTVRASAAGFTLFEKSGVTVSPGQSIGLDAQLTVASEKQEVTVQAEETQQQLSTDPANNAGALVLKGADLDALSDDPDDLQSDLQALAGPAAGPNGGQIFIDGFSGGRLPPKESIREIRINSNPFAAEYDKLGFGRIEIITKPGTDKFRGQAFFNFGDKVFDSRNPFSTTQAPFQSRQFGGSVSGPLTKKASFFLDFEKRDIDEAASIVGSNLDSSLNIVPFSATLATPLRRTTLSPRIDYQLNANNTLSGRYSFTDITSDNQGVGQFTLASRAYNTTGKDQSAALTETAILNTHTINETRFQYYRTRSDQSGMNSVPTLNVSGAFVGGGAPFSLNFLNEDSYELQNYTTMTHGTHQIKFGARLRGYQEDSQSTSNFNGTYTFAGTQGLSSIQLYQQTLLLLQQGLTSQQIHALGYGPSQFSLTAGSPLAGVSQFDAGLFVSDDWRVRPNLTLSGGLRYELQTNIGDHADLAPRLGFAWAPGKSSGGMRPKMVIRGGTGIFYDRFSQDLTLNASRFNGVTDQQFVVRNPNFFANAQGIPVIPSLDALASAQQTQAMYKVDSHLRSPYIIQSAIGIERQLPKNITLSLNYTNSRGLHQLRTRNINAPLPGTYDPTVPNSGVRPFGTQAGDIYLYESSGVFNQNQLITSVQARVNAKINLFGFYSLSTAKSNTDGIGTFPANTYNLATEYGRAGFDARNRAFIGGNVVGPKAISFSPFIMLASGMPFNITTGTDLNGDGLFTDRPAFATDLSRPSVVHTTYGVFDINPLPGQTIIPRNYGQGPGVVSLNLRVSRTWGFGERRDSSANGMGGFGGPGGPGGGGGPRGGGGPPGGGNMGFGGPRGGMFGSGGSGNRYTLTASINARNVINHVNLGQPVGVLTSPYFGESTSIGGGFGPGGPGGPGGGGAATNRKIELMLRFTF